MNHNSSNIKDNNTVTDQAVDWCMRRHDNELTKQEQAEFDAWIKSDNRHAHEYDKALKIWNLSAQLLPVFSDQAKFNNDLVDDSNVYQHPRSNWSTFAQVACMAMFVIPVLGFVGWQTNLIPNSFHSYTAEQSRQQHTLPDGSVVELNVNTQLSYANYRDRRQITLNQGEVYFDVAHNKEHPFKVSTASGEITVTGTRFNVWNYLDNVAVSVTQGSVNVKNSYAETNLTPGLQTKFSASNPQLLVKNVETNQVLAWRNGQLILDDQSLAEAIPLINRYLKETPLF